MEGLGPFFCERKSAWVVAVSNIEEGFARRRLCSLFKSIWEFGQDFLGELFHAYLYFAVVRVVKVHPEVLVFVSSGCCECAVDSTQVGYDVSDFVVGSVRYLEVVNMPGDGQLVTVDDLVADTWVVRVHDEVFGV